MGKFSNNYLSTYYLQHGTGIDYFAALAATFPQLQYFQAGYPWSLKSPPANEALCYQKGFLDRRARHAERREGSAREN